MTDQTIDYFNEDVEPIVDEVVETPNAQEEVVEETVQQEAAPATEGVVTEEPAVEAAPVENIDPETGETIAPAVDEYKPNFNFTVKGQEFEFDEFLRGAVKDKETEDKVRELYEKAEGIAFIKDERKAVKEEFNSYKEEVEQGVLPVINRVQEFDHSIKEGNLDRAFDLAGIETEQVEKWLHQKYQLEKLGPVHQQNHQASLAAQAENYKLQQQLQQYETQNTQSIKQSFDSEMNNAIQSHSEIVQAFDARAGRIGAFREAVMTYGAGALQNNRDLTPDQAVQEVVTNFGLVAPQAANQTTAAMQPQQPQQSQQMNAQPVQATPATLPNIGTGSTQTPVRTVAKNFDDWEAQLKASMK